MIAAHGWDLAGAARAGLSTGFVERPAHYPEPLFPPPDYRAPDLDALASALIANRHPG
jgi:2-haloacid dehalogenase